MFSGKGKLDSVIQLGLPVDAIATATGQVKVYM